MKTFTQTDIIQWDVKSWSKALNFWENSVDWSKVSTCLELGGREGGLSLWLAGKEKKTICSDLKDVHLTAQPLHEKHGVVQFIQYEDIDATQIPYENHFDIIVFKSIIGGIGAQNAIEKQERVFEQIYKALKPGGICLFAENLTASSFHQFMRRRFVNWSSSWRYVTEDEMRQFMRPFSSKTLKTTGFSATFGRNEKQRAFLGFLDDVLLNHITPRTWKYIVYGFAQK